MPPEERIEGDRQFRFAEGYDTLVKGMSDAINWKSCELRLNTTVAEIEWSPGKSLVKTADGMEFSAPRCIVTVPLGQSLKSGSHPWFHPPLTQKRARAARFGDGCGPASQLVLSR